MSVAAKTVLMKSIEEDLTDMLTVSQLNSVMGTVSSNIEEYEVEHSGSGEANAGSEEFLTAFLSAKEIEGLHAKSRDQCVIRHVISA